MIILINNKDIGPLRSMIDQSQSGVTIKMLHWKISACMHTNVSQQKDINDHLYVKNAWNFKMAMLYVRMNQHMQILFCSAQWQLYSD